MNGDTVTSRYASLEGQFETKLDIARRAGARNLTCCAAAYDHTGNTEVGMIKQVEELSPEFQSEALVDTVLLNQRDIPFIKAKSGQDVTAGIPEPRRSVLQSLRERVSAKATGVKPEFRNW
jgi:hypothetical protein